jgi:hypothetical protein
MQTYYNVDVAYLNDSSRIMVVLTNRHSKDVYVMVLQRINALIWKIIMSRLIYFKCTLHNTRIYVSQEFYHTIKWEHCTIYRQDANITPVSFNSWASTYNDQETIYARFFA